MHPKLVELGLLSFVDARRRPGLRRLFEGELDNWTYEEGYGRGIGYHFNPLVRQLLDEEVKGRKVFHSLRHTQATVLRDRDVPIELIEAIAGRASSDNRRPTTGERVYIKPEQLRRLQEAVERLDFGDALDAVNPFPAI